MMHLGQLLFERLSNEEVATALGISRATVQRELRFANAWATHRKPAVLVDLPA